MRVFLFRLALFGLLLWAVCSAIHHALLFGLHQRDNYTLSTWNRMWHGRIGAEVLFIGSSRAFMHFDAEHIGKLAQRECFNAGLDGSRPNIQQAFLDIFLKRNRTPALVVHEIGRLSLERPEGVMFPLTFAPYLEEPALLRTLAAMDPVWYKDRYVPLYSFMRHGVTLTGMAWKGIWGANDAARNPLRSGFYRKNKTWDGTFDRWKKMYPQGKPIDVDTNCLETLRKTIRLARKAGSAYVLVYAPELLEMQRLTPERERIFSLYRDLAKEEKVPFWDFSSMPWCADRQYFYNSQHLNSKGVDLFTPIIAEQLRNWFEGQHPSNPH
jgi:hypothetical protein